MSTSDFSLQIEAFAELGIPTEMAYILSEVIVQSEQTYSRMLILSEHVTGKTKDLLIVFLQRYEKLPRELAESVFENVMAGAR